MRFRKRWQEVSVRRYIDPEGRAWDVVVGRESWGALYALFVPLEPRPGEPPRQALLGAVGYNEAHAELASLPEAELAELFRRATPKEP